MKRIALRVALAVAVIAAIAAGLAWQQRRAPAPTAAAAPDPAATGSYADDWQAQCGPLTGAAQESCATRLNARYGRAEDAPVPKPSP